MMGVGHLNAARTLMRSFAPDDTDECSDIERLKMRIDQQNLCIQTLLVLLLEKGIIREDEFNGWARRMDEIDGVRDGRLSADTAPVRCPGCGYESSHDATECSECGQELEPRLVQRP